MMLSSSGRASIDFMKFHSEVKLPDRHNQIKFMLVGTRQINNDRQLTVNIVNSNYMGFGGAHLFNIGTGVGVITGKGSGIVTVAGKPDSKRILCFNRKTMQIEAIALSNKDGTYLLGGLDLSQYYLVLAIDDNEQYEPVAWDFIKPVVQQEP